MAVRRAVEPSLQSNPVTVRDLPLIAYIRAKQQADVRHITFARLDELILRQLAGNEFVLNRYVIIGVISTDAEVAHGLAILIPKGYLQFESYMENQALIMEREQRGNLHCEALRMLIDKADGIGIDNSLAEVIDIGELIGMRSGISTAQVTEIQSCCYPQLIVFDLPEIGIVSIHPCVRLPTCLDISFREERTRPTPQTDRDIMRLCASHACAEEQKEDYMFTPFTLHTQYI